MKMGGLVAAAMVMAAAAPVSAAKQVSGVDLQFQGGSDVYSGTFGRAMIGRGDFADTLKFTLNQSRLLFSASLTSTATSQNKAGDINFTSVSLADSLGKVIGGFKIENGKILSSAYLENALLLDAGSYTLNIGGFSFGSAQYGGNTTVAAVPEAATWMTMLVGFGAIGGAIRARRSSRTLANA
ncbi:FxDxF family PEP-CTERM protein [uncultured Sphingomonas sp.]|uniref:FxDxF family PEP-CTERM protein n=1 Tax=uncultured Sphingomonas sp. TaxID=158754 RepID=UPI0025EAE0BB|nr:FxDxF family PEP-CTERM protein [uncultured Sphingomonas sp.]